MPELNYTVTERGTIRICEHAMLPPAATRIARPNLTRLMESDETPTIIYPKFHLIRAGVKTRNKTIYPAETLMGHRGKREGLYSLVRPFRIPYIQNHESGGYRGTSEIFGRVINGFMVGEALGGGQALAGIIAVPHPYAIQQILGGNWQTVSIGSETEEATCGICGADLIGKPCDHTPWNDEDFSVIIGRKGFHIIEVSNVLVPSDVGAQKVEDNVDPKAYKLFASEPTRESVYDLADPSRANMLEGADEDDRNIASMIYSETQRLLDEFAPVRRQYFILRENAHTTTPWEVSTMPTTPGAPGLLDPKLLVEYPDTAFGVVYADETSKRVHRRFPIFPALTPEQRESVKAQITGARDLDPEQVTALLVRLETCELADPIVVTITATNYQTLHELVDAAVIGQHTFAEALSSVPAPPVDQADALAEAHATIEALTAERDALKTAEATPTADVTALQAELTEAREQLAAEVARRTALLSGIIAAKKLASGEAIAAGKTLEQLVEHYTQQPMPVLEYLYTEVTVEAPVVVDTAKIEQIEDIAPLTTTNTQVADPSALSKIELARRALAVSTYTDAEEATVKDMRFLLL